MKKKYERYLIDAVRDTPFATSDARNPATRNKKAKAWEVIAVKFSAETDQECTANSLKIAWDRMLRRAAIRLQNYEEAGGTFASLTYEDEEVIPYISKNTQNPTLFKVPGALNSATLQQDIPQEDMNPEVEPELNLDLENLLPVKSEALDNVAPVIPSINKRRKKQKSSRIRHFMYVDEDDVMDGALQQQLEVLKEKQKLEEMRLVAATQRLGHREEPKYEDVIDIEDYFNVEQNYLLEDLDPMGEEEDAYA